MTEIKYNLSIKTLLFDYILTIAICTLIAVILTLLGSHEYFLKNFILSQSFGLCICSLILLSLRVFRLQNRAMFLCVVLVAVGAGALLGLLLGMLTLKQIFNIDMNWPVSVMLQTMIAAVIFSAGFLYFFVTLSMLKQRKEEIEQERNIRVEREKEALETKLRMLQAQIEPHFLFNTLSNVVSLIDTDPSRGKAMLLDLTRYLRTSLARTMPEKTSLGQELDMIISYLNIQKIRMGERLTFTVDVPDELKGTPFPPMLLQPLVENAVRHGLEPKIEGGGIQIRGRADQSSLRIEVSDTGQGISSMNAGGVGMKNVRDRLALLFGDRAKFIVEENSPSGVKAVIEVPVHD